MECTNGNAGEIMVHRARIWPQVLLGMWLLFSSDVSVLKPQSDVRKMNQERVMVAVYNPKSPELLSGDQCIEKKKQ